MLRYCPASSDAFLRSTSQMTSTNFMYIGHVGLEKLKGSNSLSASLRNLIKLRRIVWMCPDFAGLGSLYSNKMRLSLKA